MATITEDYVSFKTAFLLKEKGFNAEIDTYYSPEGEFDIWYPNERKSYLTNDGNETWWWKCIAPSQSMAMKWLRKVHNIAIVVTPSMFWGKYNVSIYKKGNDYPYGFDGDSLISSYEQACEAAILYCLTNLI